MSKGSERRALGCRSRGLAIVATLLIGLMVGCQPESDPPDGTDGGSSADGGPSDAEQPVPDADGGESEDGSVSDATSDSEDGQSGDVRDTIDLPTVGSTEHFEWVRYDDWAHGSVAYEDLEVGAEGGLFVAGTVKSGPDESASASAPSRGIVAKYTSDGEYVWSHVVESPTPSSLDAVAVTASGGVYAVGERPGGDGESADSVNYLLELDSEGERVGRNAILTSGEARLDGLVLLDGDVGVVGQADAEDFGETVGDGREALAAKIAPDSGETVWVRFLGNDGMYDARSAVSAQNSGGLYMPVYTENEPEGASPTKLYRLESDGTTDNSNSLPLNSPSLFPHVTLQEDAIRFGGRNGAEEGDQEVATTGGTPVYPTVDFDETFGSDGDDRATDIASASGGRAWLVGRWNHGDSSASAGFASPVSAGGSFEADVVFGDGSPAEVDPRAVAVDAEGNVFVAGATATAFDGGPDFPSEATFVGRLLPDSGP